ncbi:MAG: hypothetical protein ACKVIQ_09600 [Acidimicrobiales bacterium]
MLHIAHGLRSNSFQPLQNSFFDTHEIPLTPDVVIAVGDFTIIKGVSSPLVAVFYDTGGTAPDQARRPTPWATSAATQFLTWMNPC